MTADLTYLVPFALTALFSVLSTLAGTWLKDRMHERQAAKDVESGAGWRANVLDRIRDLSAKIDAVTEAQHVAMRQSLGHTAEKYLTRGWWADEERKAWWEMFNAYEDLGQNGFMIAYWEQLVKLPVRSIEEIINSDPTDQIRR